MPQIRAYGLRFEVESANTFFLVMVLVVQVLGQYLIVEYWDSQDWFVTICRCFVPFHGIASVPSGAGPCSSSVFGREKQAVPDSTLSTGTKVVRVAFETRPPQEHQGPKPSALSVSLNRPSYKSPALSSNLQPKP